AQGDGLAMAARAGAVIADPEFVQFHPTAINAGIDPAPLATEALRGDGATLVNGHGTRFMTALHDDAELAPRDIVARAVHRENASGRGAFLDCRAAIGDAFSTKFPSVFEMCRRVGIDPARELIPVAPAAHYHMGGVLTDACGRTSVDGLWACGEVASSGLHGANRLASNSLIEAVVFGARVAEDISGTHRVRSHASVKPSASKPGVSLESSPARTDALVARLRAAMSSHAGVVRTGEGLRGVFALIEDLASKARGNLALQNMLLAARFIVHGALMRRESRGGHFRSDMPVASEARDAVRTFLTLDDLARVDVTQVMMPVGDDADNVVPFPAVAGGAVTSLRAAHQ
ncbi:MAG: FAD-binding protein, partial [Pseudomonadota bacterium]